MSCLLCGKSHCALVYEDQRHFYHCEHCDLIFVPELEFVALEREKLRYEKHENSIAERGYVAYLANSLHQFQAECIPGGEYLDYGSGKEMPLQQIARSQGISCASFDLHFHPDMSLFLKCYAGIFCFETCEHFRDPWRQFHHLVSLLKPGAFLAIRTEFVPQDFPNWYYHRDITHVCFYSIWTFQWLAQSLGLHLILCESPYVLLKRP